MLVTPDAEVAKTLSIFGVMDLPVALGVVEGLVTPKRVEGLDFYLLPRFNGGESDSRYRTFEEGTYVLIGQRLHVIICEITELKLYCLQIFCRVIGERGFRVG